MYFHGFSADSFEQFIRALALKVFGPGVTVFGNGPDGGREATFHGHVPYPYPPASEWDGYGVIQAKYKEKAESAKLDQAWAREQLEAELDIWTKSANRSPKPEYFVFCTNVELSSAKNGGRERLEKILTDRASTLGLRAYAIWDANQLKGFVDSIPEIRSRFECFFTPGDLLHQLSKRITRVPDPDAVLTSYLCQELSADEDAKLSQAGDRSEDRIRLANVFVDLPCNANPYKEEAEEVPSHLALLELAKAANKKLDPIALYEQQDGSKTDSTTSSQARFLFIGGPGSGKSTIGQCLAQVHRAAILDRKPRHRLESRIVSIINEVKLLCERECLDWPSTPRYPFRIELNAFAKSLAQDGTQTLTLSKYIRTRISQDVALSHEDFRDWLKVFPTMLILDGLDEVPSSSNRRELISAIQIFLNEARDVEADLLIIASSRPHGYGGEFDGEEVAHRYLIPLPQDRALACAQRYVDAKIVATGKQRATEAMETLTRAIENPLIAKLMRSPLQVTFMVTVVCASGKPSDSRWQLFNDYYRIIYERELHKAVRPFDQILNERRQNIDTLHQKVGFILQYRGESSGEGQADLPRSEFEDLVSQCLAEDGLTSTELERQRDMILGAANLRLVFLTSRVPGRLSFDVRSLQEYMAAAHMTNGDSTEIMVALEAIAHSEYWRNTILFAIGRFFAEPHLRPHRDKIRVLCDDLNLRDTAELSAKLGSRLALDILASGTIGNVPLFSRSLADCALDLLGVPEEASSSAYRLAEVYEPAMEVEFRQHIGLLLGQMEAQRTLAAWLTLFHLEKRGVSWAKQVIGQNWPKDPTRALGILNAWFADSSDYEMRDEIQRFIVSNHDVPRLVPLLQRVSPREIFRREYPPQLSLVDDAEQWQSICDWAIADAQNSMEVSLVVSGGASGFQVYLAPLPREADKHVFGEIRKISADPDSDPEWNLLVPFVEFYERPSSETLATSLLQVASMQNFSDSRFCWNRLAWPLQCCLKFAENSDQLVHVAERVKAGLLGDIGMWREKEKRWRTTGLTLNEIATTIFPDGPVLADVINRGRSPRQSASVDPAIVNEILRSISAHQPRGAQNTLAWIALYMAENRPILHKLDPELVHRALLARLGVNSQTVLPSEQFSVQDHIRWRSLFSELGNRKDLKFGRAEWKVRRRNFEFLTSALKEDNTKLGILRLLGFLAAAGASPVVDFSRASAIGQLDNKYLLSVLLIRMSDPALTKEEATNIASYIASEDFSKDEPLAFELIVSALDNHCSVVPNLSIVLDAVLPVLRIQSNEEYIRAESLKVAMIASSPSRFSRPTLLKLGAINKHTPKSESLSEHRGY